MGKKERNGKDERPQGSESRRWAHIVTEQHRGKAEMQGSEEELLVWAAEEKTGKHWTIKLRLILVQWPFTLTRYNCCDTRGCHSEPWTPHIRKIPSHSGLLPIFLGLYDSILWQMLQWLFADCSSTNYPALLITVFDSVNCSQFIKSLFKGAAWVQRELHIAYKWVVK